MADKKISALTAATTPLAGTEVLPIVQSGTTSQVSVANLTAGRAVNASTIETTGEARFGTTNSGGSATNTNKTIGGVFTTLHQSGISLLTSTATTLFTLANLGEAQTWLVIANCNGNASSVFHSVAIVRANNTNVSVTSLVASALGVISASGLNIQYTQSSGGTQPGGMFFAIRLS